MSYAGDRVIIDADSHLMERPGFLTDHADAAVRDRLPALSGGLSNLDLDAGGHSAEQHARARRVG